MNQDNKRNSFCVCPRCQQKTYVDEQFCRNCGFDISTSDEKVVSTTLSFGLKEQVNVVNDETNELSFTQNETKLMRLFKKFHNIILFVIGSLALMLLFLPLFNDNNIWSFIEQMQEMGYKFNVAEYLSFDKKVTLTELFNPIMTYLSSDEKMINPSLFVFIYEALVLFLSLVIVLLGGLLIALGIRNLVYKHQIKHYKISIGIILALSLVLVLVLECLGIGPILLAIFSFLSLVMFYIWDIVSKEKRFVIRHLVHKSICAILLFVLLVFSSFGLVNLNAKLGVNLYNFLNYPINGTIEAPLFVSCRGILYEFVQFIQCSSGDDVFTSVTFTFCLLTFIAHFIYIIFIVVSISNLVRSLSKQNVKFPVYSIIVSTIAFYAFAVFSTVFNQVVNDAMFQKFVETVGTEAFEQFSVLEIEASREYNRIFVYKNGMLISMLLNLPVCIYSFIARKICYKKYN